MTTALARRASGSRSERRRLSGSCIAIECALAMSGTYQTGTLLPYLPRRTNKRTNGAERSGTSERHGVSLLVAVIVIITSTIISSGCQLLRNRVARVARARVRRTTTTARPSRRRPTRDKLDRPCISRTPTPPGAAVRPLPPRSRGRAPPSRSHAS